MNSNERVIYLKSGGFFSPHIGPARAADLTQIESKLIFFLDVLVISYFMAQPRMTCKNKRKDELENI